MPFKVFWTASTTTKTAFRGMPRRIDLGTVPTQQPSVSHSSLHRLHPTLRQQQSKGVLQTALLPLMALKGGLLTLQGAPMVAAPWCGMMSPSAVPCPGTVKMWAPWDRNILGCPTSQEGTRFCQIAHRE